MLLDDGTDGVSEEAIGAGIEVHKKFGPGLLERAYNLPMVWALQKSIATILPIHIAQVSTYLSLSGIRVGLLMNFNVPVLRHGIKRVLHPDLPRIASDRNSRR